jgi:hypothetical protein
VQAPSSPCAGRRAPAEELRMSVDLAQLESRSSRLAHEVVGKWPRAVELPRRSTRTILQYGTMVRARVHTMVHTRGARVKRGQHVSVLITHHPCARNRRAQPRDACQKARLF